MDEVTIQQIRMFVSAAECGSFSAVAEELYSTQASVSKWISKLERQLDCKLFKRGPRGVTLTDKGKKLCDAWRILLQEYDLSVKQIHEVTTARIGCMTQIRNELCVTRALHMFTISNKNTEVYLEVYEYRELLQKLFAGEFDVAFTYSFGSIDERLLNWHDIQKVPLYLTGTPEMISKRDKTLLIVSEDGAKNGAEQAVSSMKKMNIPFSDILTYPNISSLQIAISQGRGVGMTGAYMHLEDPSLVAISTPLEYTTNHISMIWRKDSDSEVPGMFVDILKNT